MHSRLASSLMIVTLFGCSTEDGGERKQVNKDVVLERLTVSDRTLVLGADATGAGGASDASLTSWAETVHPIMKQRCANCHATSVSPLFAVSDAAKSLQAINQSQKIDLGEPVKSRLVERLTVDMHNCWGDCKANGEEILKAVNTWIAASGDAVVNVDTLPLKTAGLKLADARYSTIANPNPAGTWKWESEAGLVSPPMILGNNSQATGRKFIQQNNLNGLQAAQLTNAAIHTSTTAADQAIASRIGRVRFPFQVTTAGSYLLHGRVSSAAAGSFFVRIIQVGQAPGPVTQWNVPANVAGQPPFRWLPVTANNVPVPFNLTPGQYEAEVITRQINTQLDAFAVTTTPNADASQFLESPINVMSLVYDLSSLVPGVTFMASVREHSAQSYAVSRPYLATSTHTVWVKQIVPLVNGKSSPQSAMFNLVDVAVTPPGKLLSEGTMILLKGEQGSAGDQIGIGFGALEKVDSN
jgi:hypothetical protein